MKSTKSKKLRSPRIVHVAPLSKSVQMGYLSYFTSQEIPLGSIVTVEVRKKNIPALVIGMEDASALKSKIRSSDFVMKKITDASSMRLFLPSFIKAAEDTAHFFATSTGNIVRALTPNIIIETQSSAMEITDEEEDASPSLKPQPYVFQANDEERIATYKSLIRQAFAEKSSVFLCLPTREDTATVLSTLEKGIQQYTYVLHGGLKKEKIVEEWEHALKEKHPVLIVGTASFLSLPRKDIKTIIIEKESSRHYKTLMRPFFDIRTFAEFLAKRAGAKLILADTILRTETLWREAQKECLPFVPMKFRILSPAKGLIVNMAEKKKEGKTFQVLGDELKKLIEKTKSNDEHMYIFTARRGMSSVTICNDCGTIVACKTCETPAVLHKGAKGNTFVCHRCSSTQVAEDRCSGCGGWRLVPLGTGIERVEETIAEMFPDVKLFRMDKDSTSTHKKRSAVMEEFYDSPGSILVGTEMALAYLSQGVDNTAAVGIDSLLAIPDFRAREHMFHTLISLRSKTRKNILIQTRNSSESIFAHAISGNILDFYRGETEARKRFNYPPFSVLIKVTCAGARASVLKQVFALEKLLEAYKPHSYPSSDKPYGSAFAMNIMIKLPRDAWVDKYLVQILQSLPRSCAVRVDPERIL